MMRVVFFGTYNARSHPRVAVLRNGLRAHGVEVVECNRPLQLDTAARVSLLRQPWRLPILIWHIAQCWWQLWHDAAPLRRDPSISAVVVGYMGHFDVLLARRLFRGTPIVLDHLIGASDTAADRGVHAGPRQLLLRGLDSAALRSADIVLVDTDEHLATLPEPHRRKALVVWVGAPDAWFNAGADADRTIDSAHPFRVVFFGLYTPLQNAPVIGAALAELADAPIDVTMIGNGQEFEATKAAAAANRRVRWVEWMDADELPAEVAAHDVCLGIFGTSAKALRVVPNKVFQGAAAGCVVVTSDTEPQRRIVGDAAVFVPPGDAHALADTLRQLTADPASCAARRHAARSLAEQRFTAEAVVHNLVDAIANAAPHAALHSPL